MRLSVVVPDYESIAETLSLIRRLQDTSRHVLDGEVLVVSDSMEVKRQLPDSVTYVHWPEPGGLAQAKNAALHAARGDLVLFLFPFLEPRVDAIDRLVEEMRTHPQWGAIAGRWENVPGRVEVGYNVRNFPTFASLAFDLLLLNKILPRNRWTLRYKMLDFNHEVQQTVEHCNDCVFMIWRTLALDVGGFDEIYRFGWFDQVEMCMTLRQAGRPIVYDPLSVFISFGRLPILNRMLRNRYVDFYRDETTFVTRHYGPGRVMTFKLLLATAMLLRLSFSYCLPAWIRAALIRHYRPYVDDRYIQSMRHSYVQLLGTILRKRSFNA